MRVKDKIKFKIQKAKKGYCDYDLYSIDLWFINIFPKMLEEFINCTCGCPCNEKDLTIEVVGFPNIWKEQQRPLINKILKKYDEEYNLNDSMCCWLLILLRMKYCFEMCDEWNKEYDKCWDKNEYEFLNKTINKHKQEAFYLFEKYFFDLWW